MNEPFNEKNDSFASLQSRREKSTFPNYLKQGQTLKISRRRNDAS